MYELHAKNGNKILVVCGSRTLSANLTARVRFADVFEGRANGVNLVAHGGASGPDTWADIEARRLGIGRIVFCLKLGKPYAIYGTTKMDIPWADSNQYHGPLARNRAMAEWAARCQRQGALVTVIGFVDDNSATKGTDHMLKQATASGLTTVRYSLWAATEGADE